MPTLDLSIFQKLLPSIRQVTDASKKAFGTDLVGIAVKGSAVRGDFIPYYSDLDLHIFLHEGALLDARTPRIEPALDLQEALGNLDFEKMRVSTVQLTFHNVDNPQSEWTPTPPEVSRVVYGTVPEYDRESGNWRTEALEMLDMLQKEVLYQLKSVPDKPNSAVANLVRREGAFLKGGGYSLAGLLSNDIRRAQLMPFWELDEYLEKETSGSVNLSSFHTCTENWITARNDIEMLRSMFRIGITNLLAMASLRKSLAPKL